MEQENKSMEYNPLEKLEQSLHAQPYEQKNSVFGYYAKNKPEGAIDVFNAHSNQIMNKTQQLYTEWLTVCGAGQWTKMPEKKCCLTWNS